MSEENKVVQLAPKKREASSQERIWGKPVISHGFAGIPSMLIQLQARLGLSPLQMNIIIQLLDYWHEPERKPFPSKADLARRIGVKSPAIRSNIKALEEQGLVRREMRRTAAGDWNSNRYHLDGLVERIQSMEPEYAVAKAEKKKKAAEAAEIETPVGRRTKAVK